jgi:hypothetical protein
MKSKKKKTKHYLAMWDMQGLECLFDVGAEIAEHNAWEKEKIVSILKEQPVPKRKHTIPLQMMILRAKVNSQRAYEIYEFNSTIEYDELKKAFNDDPQPIVEWIRENGYKVFSNYVKPNKKLIV